jgi:hypothetical protein
MGYGKRTLHIKAGQRCGCRICLASVQSRSTHQPTSGPCLSSVHSSASTCAAHPTTGRLFSRAAFAQLRQPQAQAQPLPATACMDGQPPCFHLPHLAQPPGTCQDAASQHPHPGVLLTPAPSTPAHPPAASCPAPCRQQGCIRTCRGPSAPWSPRTGTAPPTPAAAQVSGEGQGRVGREGAGGARLAGMAAPSSCRGQPS